MSLENAFKQRLTIHNFALPLSKAQPSKSSFHKKQKPSLHLNYQSEKRIICGQGPTSQPRERWSEEFVQTDHLGQKFASLPEISCKSKTLDTSPLSPQERMHSFSSRKLNVNAYHKIEQSINKKYCRKMESLASLQPRPQKMFSINNLKGDLPLTKHPERDRQEHIQRYKVEKHHIDRLKDQFQIPLELHTQRYREQEFDDRQLSLQLKNVIRFEFHTQMNFVKPKKAAQEEVTVIDGWDIGRSTIRPAAHLYS